MRPDDTASRRLQSNVIDLIAILLAERGLEVERFEDGRRPLPALEIRDISRGAVVLHCDQVIG